MTTPWFPYYNPRPYARLRLFCFHHAGGNASLFRLWSEMLPPQVDICALQLPGRENRLMETPITYLPHLIEKLVPVFLPYLDIPYAFFGHSMGASIGFELVHALRQSGCPSPVRLVVSGRRGPRVENREPPIYDLPDPAFIEKLREFEGTPEEILQHEELLPLLLPTIRADFTLAETYSYQIQAPLSCPISAYGGLQDKEVTYDDITAWRQETSSTFVQRMFPGNHFFLHAARANLLQVLARDLLSSP